MNLYESVPLGPKSFEAFKTEQTELLRFCADRYLGKDFNDCSYELPIVQIEYEKKMHLGVNFHFVDDQPDSSRDFI